MSDAVHTETFLKEEGPIFDVRSPSEYAKGHLPGAISFPLFTDQERHEVGLCYQQEGQTKATILGLQRVGPKLAALSKEALSLSQGKQVRVYCWRGGERSGSMCWLFERVGIPSVRLSGGYKAYRRYVLENLHFPPGGIVIGGFTGSGKTEILHALERMGEQVIDLEALARHKGSAFGLEEGEIQPSMEFFENQLFHELSGIEDGQRVWLEDESQKIGTIFIRPEFYDGLKKAPLFVVQKTVEERAETLARVYGQQSEERLIEGFKRIAKRLGGQHLKEAINLVKENAYAKAALIALRYYDKTYTYGLNHRENINVQELDARGLKSEDIAEKLIALANESQ